MAERLCTQCGAACGANARFCAACGHALATADAAGARWGEVKAATILFADIVDSTRQIAELSPEQAMQQLQPAVARLVRIVEAYGGTVLRTLGDGIMALFGVPKALEQHSERACLAAARMQQLYAHPPDGTGLTLRVGLHTGKVASDPTEAGDRRGGGAHGVAIHLASRVAAQAAPGQVLLTDDTRHLLRPGLLVARPAGSWHLKGIVQPVTLYALQLGTGSASVPDPAAPAARFVGRDGEMAQLMHALGRTRAGQGQVVCVSGAAGGGKTRLCAEFARRCQDLGAQVVWVQTHPLSHALPLRPARELLGALCLDVTPALAPAEARRRIDVALARAGHAGAADTVLVHELMGVADDSAPAPARSPSAPDSRQLRLLALVAELVRADAQALRLVVLEDLHWLDLASWPVLSAVAEALAETRTLLLVNQRPTEPTPWPRLGHVTMLPLDTLAPQAVRAIVAERLAALPLPGTGDASDWIDRVAERSQGNPFFAQELVRHLRRTGADPKRWAAELPDSIDALIAARIDALPEEDKRVLQTAAIIGKQVNAAVLARVLQLPRGRLAPALRRLQAAELLALADSGAGGRDLSFFHPLIQEAAYAAQLTPHRQRLHQRVAEEMARRYGDGARAGDMAAMLAHHFEQAGQHLVAARHAVRAAQWLRTGDAAVAIAAWRRVLLLLEAESANEEARMLSALAAGRIVFLGWRVGITMQEVTQLVDRALDTAGDVDPRLPQLLRFAQARMAQASGGSADDYLRAVQALLRLPDPPGDPGRRATLHVVLSQAYSWAGLLRESLAASDVALAGIEQVSQFDQDFIGFSVEQWAIGLRIRVLCRMGRLAEARAYCERLALLAEEEPDVVMKGIAHNLQWELDALQGHGRRAWAWAQRQDRALRQRNDYLRITGAYFLSFLELANHHYALAGTHIQGGLSQLREKRVAVDFEVELLALSAEALAARALWPAAARMAQQTIELARRRANRVCECRAALVLARAELQGLVVGPADAPGQGTWLAHAEHLLNVTGAELWRPRWRALSARARLAAGV